MPKRARVGAEHTRSNNKRNKTTAPGFRPIKVATAEAASAVDANPPFKQLLSTLQNAITLPAKGQSVVYWMRMGDLRITDNRALSLASKQATIDNVPLIVIFLLSPQDYIAHDRSTRRIDFTLRNLSKLKTKFADLHIPLHTITHTPRRTIPSRIISLVTRLGSTRLFANFEYEVDEVRRDIKICELSEKEGIKPSFLHNKCIVEPGVVYNRNSGTYAVYSRYQRNWLNLLNGNLPHYLEDCPRPTPNNASIHESERFASLFDTPVPDVLQGFELVEEDRETMCQVFPEGEDAAAEILERFLTTKARPSQLGAMSPFTPGAETSEKANRILNYSRDRDRADRDTTSRLSVYLSAGVISVRECVRATMQLLKIKKVDASRDTGVGKWVQELAWRDFYTCILVGYPRVSMGRPFLERFSAVVWENHQSPEDSTSAAEHHDEFRDSEPLKRWKEGMTGVPIVDATMRCLKQMGWLHNRNRMITAMFLTKDLMIDWRVGERYFMETLIDGDLASNNGGWQWSASTGVDPAPYFRIFNPYNQSTQADPSGDFIRHWVPELRSLQRSDLHNPPGSMADKLGYPRPIVKHEEARERALRRFKNPGEQ